MAQELDDKERETIRKKKEETIGSHQHKLDIFRQKVKQWDEDVSTKKSENGKRMWNESKFEMNNLETKVQEEINRLSSLTEEEWKNETDHFDSYMGSFTNVYNNAVSKIRYDNPGQNLSDKVFKQKIS